MPISYKGTPLNEVYYQGVYLKKIYMDGKLVFYPGQYTNVIFRWYRDYSYISKVVETQEHKDWVSDKEFQQKLLQDARDYYKNVLLQVQIKHGYFEAEAEYNEAKRLEGYYRDVVAKTKAELEQAIKNEQFARMDISRYESAIRDAENKYETAQRNLANIQSQIPAAQSEVDEVSARLQQARSKLDTAQSNLSTEQSNFAPINNEMQARETKVNETAAEKTRLQQATQTSWNNYTNAKSTYNSASSQAASAKSTVERHCSADSGSVSSKLSEYQSQLNIAQEQYEQNMGLVQRYQEDINDYQNTINTATAERDGRQQELYTQYVTNDPYVIKLKDEIARKTAQIAEYDSQLNGFNSEIQRLTDENNTIQNVEIPGYRTDYNNAKTDEARIDQQIRDAEAAGASSSVIEALKGQKALAQQKQKDALENIKTAEGKVQSNNGKITSINTEIRQTERLKGIAEAERTERQEQLATAERNANQNFLNALNTDSTYQNAKREAEVATSMRDRTIGWRNDAQAKANANQATINKYSGYINELNNAWNTYQTADATAKQAKSDMDRYYSEWQSNSSAYETAKTDYTAAVSDRNAYQGTYNAAKAKVDQAQREYNSASSAYNIVASEAQRKQSKLDNLLNQERQYKSDMYSAQSDKMSAESGLSIANSNLNSALNTQEACRKRLPGEEEAYNNSVVRRQNAEGTYNKAKEAVQNDPDRIKAEQDLRNSEANYNKWVKDHPEPTFGATQTIKRYRWVYKAEYYPRVKRAGRRTTTIKIEWPKQVGTSTIRLSSSSQYVTGYSNTVDEDLATTETFNMLPRITVSDGVRSYVKNNIEYSEVVTVGPVEV